MPLVEMKSNLSQIDKNPFQQQISAQSVGLSTPTKSSPQEPEPLNTIQGVDYFSNINATGFTTKRNGTGLTTDYQLNENGGPIIPQTSYLDIKGDFVSLYSPTNKAVPNVYNMSDDLTPLQNIRIDTQGENQAYINYAVTPNRYGYGFIPNNSEDSKYPTIRPVQSLQSRLYNKHVMGKTNIQNTGFTRNGLSLDTYYAQQPDNLRGIGQRWDTDGVNIPFISDTVEAGLEFATSVLSEFGSATFGRNINTFVNTWKADVVRIGQFANPVSVYALKQTFLQRLNKYDRPYTQVMGLSTGISNDQLSTLLGELGSLASNSGILDINPQVYNQASIFSIPGVSGMMFNRNGRNFQDVAGLAVAGIDVVAGVAKKIGVQAAGITAQYSARAISIAAPVAANIITGTIGGAGNMLMDFAQGMTNPLSGLSNPLSGMTNPLAGMTNPLAGITNPLSGISNPLSGINNPLAGVGNPFANANVKGLGAKLLNVDLSAAKRFAGGAVDTIGAAAEKARDVAKDLTDDIGPLGKLKLMQLDQKAFQDIGVDKINLIPFGKDNYEGVTYDRLDWIPFKFVDLKENTPIVFRAVLSGITDSFSPEYTPERYMGRPDNVYVYQGTNREISFNFDVHPSSAEELFIIWEKLNYLAGQTYPHWSEPSAGGGRGMISPMTSLTIGDMYTEAPGFISSLTYTVQDNGNWEVDIAKLPKYIQVACSFTYIGNRLPSATQKHFDLPRIPEEVYETKTLKGAVVDFAKNALKNPGNAIASAGDLGAGLTSSVKKDILSKVGL